ncbi:uncharacterized protein LOC134945691 [Pseudophryne corroboree]|uniref:uncharacterized protein LOC134945691 n=1 Tax=Pseudophryne corroboree TaxID=495146 RepID=UPI0030820091
MATIPEMTRYINNFSLDDCPRGNQGFTRVLLQLFGFLGHGKSSFINTCKYVLEDGEFKTYADVTVSDGGNTTARITYPLTDTLTLVDNRGASVMNSYEIGEIFAQLGNFLPFNEEIAWSEGFKLVDKIVESEQLVKASDFIFPIFVYSVKKGMNPAEKDELKELLTTVTQLTGIFPMVILTHKTSPNLKDVKSKFKGMGVEQIFALENFTPEDHLKTRGRHEDVLKFFLEVIKDIEFRLERFQNPETERQNRKKLVINFAHNCDMKRQQDQMLAEQAAREKEEARRQANSGKCVLQ